ncbi:hypothetical protein [Cytobacillus firmus]|uniref:hypothetical protein n=1 Tax=Cytobacillus firmus TaxID=1399 RepID=UPI0018CDA2BD|nr:hypothetical protein [Cytobacillus firmus]MBG9549928.1 hypothetical protein [Cytobacillus firmus]MBG9604578.1 hypothetical protein [Cytobacillus firmus]MED1940534.1 hypothetical protein [Cytobacillus firmus]
MDRAVILGTFEFIGFSLCKHLLEQGCEIDGIHFDKEKDDALIHEKRLTIGRNANFNEKKYSAWIKSGEILKNDIIFIDTYDLYIRNELAALREKELIEGFFLKNMALFQILQVKIVFLLPIQWLKDISRTHSKLEDAIEILQENNISVSSFYMPVIYGPWQPKEFSFHQSIAKKRVMISEREWIHDAIFIDDLINFLSNCADRSLDESYLLKSSITRHWRKCADYLSFDYNENWRYPDLAIGKVTERTIQCSVKFSDGLEKQRRHFISLESPDGW